MRLFTAALLLFTAACGEGRAIFNVDVLSFLPASDSVKAYNIPGGIGPVDSTVTEQFTLPPGFGGSSVDSVTATFAAQIENATGGGSVILEVYFAQTQGALFTGPPYLADSSGPISGAQTVPLGANSISLSDSVFNATDLWVGIRARITTNVGVNMTGQVRFTDIRLRIVMQDKVL